MKNFKAINSYCNILKKDEIDFLIPPGSLRECLTVPLKALDFLFLKISNFYFLCPQGIKYFSGICYNWYFLLF